MNVAADRPWYRELTRYHWFVFIVAAIAWMVRCAGSPVRPRACRPKNGWAGPRHRDSSR